MSFHVKKIEKKFQWKKNPRKTLSKFSTSEKRVGKCFNKESTLLLILKIVRRKNFFVILYLFQLIATGPSFVLHKPKYNLHLTG